MIAQASLFMRNVPSATALLSSAQIEQVRARSDVWGAWLVLHAWTVIVAAATLVVLFPNPLTYVLAIMLIGSRQLGLLILMHDAAHGARCRTPWLNRWLAQVFCAWPTLADTAVYRAYHLRHHAPPSTGLPQGQRILRPPDKSVTF